MYLMHRVSHHSEELNQMLKEGYLPIGWGDIRKHSEELADKIIRKARDKELSKYNFGQYFKGLSEETKLTWLTARQGYFIYNFLNLNIDSIVIVPKAQVFSIYRVIETPKVFSATKTGVDEKYDIGFMVKVELLYGDVSRYDYLDSTLNSKLKFRGTNLVFNDEDKKLIDNMIQSIENKTPIDDFSETKKSILKEINQYITSIGHDKFERLVVAYLKHIGADKVVIPPKNQNGNNDARADIDVKAAFNKLGIVIYVQAKCHKGTSDTTGIQQLLAYESEEDSDFIQLVPVKWFITSGELVNNYEDLLPEKYKDKADELKYIKIINGTDFAELLFDSGFVFDSKIYKK